eukprot:TRINITY_DN4370_c1_g1_i1.p1 TRINITY_DN4370_c1_g1~~TRINITY_DN4370_c1_g1_i1.p1  ORF type:complete len:351 (+),score=47.39 TRINITY_DN4370_c1_g1_i1:139-1191(+)
MSCRDVAELSSVRPLMRPASTSASSSPMRARRRRLGRSSTCRVGARGASLLLPLLLLAARAGASSDPPPRELGDRPSAAASRLARATASALWSPLLPPWVTGSSVAAESASSWLSGAAANVPSAGAERPRRLQDSTNGSTAGGEDDFFGSLLRSAPRCSRGYFDCGPNCCDADADCFCDAHCRFRGPYDYTKGCSYNPSGGKPEATEIATPIITSVINIVKFVVSTLVCWRLNRSLIESGKYPAFGIQSCLCCFFCTCFALCLPIDDANIGAYDSGGMPVGQPVTIGMVQQPVPVRVLQGQVVHPHYVDAQGYSSNNVVQAQVVQGRPPGSMSAPVQGQVVQGTAVRVCH